MHCTKSQDEVWVVRLQHNLHGQWELSSMRRREKGGGEVGPKKGAGRMGAQMWCIKSQGEVRLQHSLGGWWELSR